MKKSIVILIGVLGLVGLLSAQSVEELMSEAMTALNNRNYESAVIIFRKVLSREPGNFEAQFNLALAYLRWDKPSEAVREFNKAISLQARNAAAWFHLGEANVNLGHEDNAVQALIHAIQLEPNRIDDLMPLAEGYFKRSVYDRAIIVYRLISRTNSLSPQTRAEAFGALGSIALNKEHNAQRARDYYANAVSLDRGHAPYWEGLALAHEALGNKAEALAAWRTCLAATSSPQKREEIQRRIAALEKHES